MQRQLSTCKRTYGRQFRWGLMACATLVLAIALAAAAPAPSGGGSGRIGAAVTISLAQRSRLKTPSREEMRQFYAELKREGREGAQIAAIYTGYSRVDASIKTTGSQFATMYGDLDGDHRPEWVVGCYFPSQATPTPDPQSMMSGMMGGRGGMVNLHDDRARIVIFKRASNEPWRIDWISPGLGYEFHAPDYNLQEVAEGLDQQDNLRLPLSLVDVDGDRRPELAYQCWSESAVVGAMPGVLRYDGTRWVSVAPQADRFSLQDLDHDGRIEVVTGSRFVGYGSGDDDVPRVWRWSGRQYQEASTGFTVFYGELAAKYRKVMARKEQKGEAFDRAAWERAIRKAASLAG